MLTGETFSDPSDGETFYMSHGETFWTPETGKPFHSRDGETFTPQRRGNLFDPRDGETFSYAPRGNLLGGGGRHPPPHAYEFSCTGFILRLPRKVSPVLQPKRFPRRHDAQKVSPVLVRWKGFPVADAEKGFPGTGG